MYTRPYSPYAEEQMKSRCDSLTVPNESNVCCFSGILSVSSVSVRRSYYEHLFAKFVFVFCLSALWRWIHSRIQRPFLFVCFLFEYSCSDVSRAHLTRSLEPLAHQENILIDRPISQILKQIIRECDNRKHWKIAEHESFRYKELLTCVDHIARQIISDHFDCAHVVLWTIRNNGAWQGRRNRIELSGIWAEQYSVCVFVCYRAIETGNWDGSICGHFVIHYQQSICFPLCEQTVLTVDLFSVRGSSVCKVYNVYTGQLIACRVTDEVASHYQRYRTKFSSKNKKTPNSSWNR